MTFFEGFKLNVLAQCVLQTIRFHQIYYVPNKELGMYYVSIFHHAVYNQLIGNFASLWQQQSEYSNSKFLVPYFKPI